MGNILALLRDLGKIPKCRSGPRRQPTTGSSMQEWTLQAADHWEFSAGVDPAGSWPLGVQCMSSHCGQQTTGSSVQEWTLRAADQWEFSAAVDPTGSGPLGVQCRSGPDRKRTIGSSVQKWTLQAADHWEFSAGVKVVLGSYPVTPVGWVVFIRKRFFKSGFL